MPAARSSSKVGAKVPAKGRGPRASAKAPLSRAKQAAPAPRRRPLAQAASSQVLAGPAAPASSITSKSGIAAPASEMAPTPSALRRIDARLIGHSRWANRIDEDADTPEFRELKASIQRAGGNVQPIKVRPIPPSVPASAVAAQGAMQFEIVFGHRRHRACLELGVPVNAIVASMDDLQLFAEMDRENRAHRALSPFEQGQMFKRALDAGLFASVRRLAQELTIDVSLVSKAIGIASLPEPVHQAFSSPNDIQYRWARPLKAACAAALQRTIDSAMRLKAQNSAASVSPSRIFQMLVSEAGVRGEDTQEVCGKQAHAAFKIDRRGRLAIWFDRRLSEALVMRLRTSLEKLLNE